MVMRTVKVNGKKVKFTLKQTMKVQGGGEKYSCTIYLTSSLDGGGWLTPRPSRFTSGTETRYPLYRRLGGPQGRSGRVLNMRTVMHLL
jgi:hypothetical protein